ncbi:hypothetical protein IQ235_03905 [Oscillatoriales cyanobacterium LEGE 11467]|uniref:DNA mismatch repair protein MutS-like N-terminal domain-containing protein n=2 Tax=Zarconia TaxID=2992130 RepID=A0A928VTM9_9CYAN|nr:hypothetical protein [Zarconia navalis LEGE 11467]
MLSLLPTAQHYDVLISLTHHFTQTGVSEIVPGTITPASKIWLDFSYQPIRFVLSAIEQFENRLPHPSVCAYLDLKAQHPDELVFIRVGDFCETFCDDAKTAAKELELVMTGKGSGEARVPMTGVPHHAFERYEAQLSQMGYTVRYFDPDNPESIYLPNNEPKTDGIDNPDNEPDSTDGIELTAPVAPPETDNTKSQESISSPVPLPVTPPVTDDKPKCKDIKEFEIDVDGTPVVVSYNPTWGIASDTVHVEFRSTFEPPQPIPCSETGYRSHFTDIESVREYSTPEAYAKAYIELNRIKAFKPTKSKTDKQNPETEEQMTLTLEGINGQQPPHIEPTRLRGLVPLVIGNVVEIADTLHPKHADRDAVGQWGKILKFTDEDQTHAIIQLIETGKRCTIPAVCLHRLQLPQLQTLGTSRTLAYATINGELHAWVGFKTKSLYSDWCCRKRDRSAYIKDLDEPKRSLYLRDKWECAIKKPTMKKLHKLAEYDFSQEPGTFFYKQRKTKEASLPQTATRPVVQPGTLVEITAESDRHIQGQVGTVILDRLEKQGEDKIVVRIGKDQQEYLSCGEFRVVDTEPQPENAPLVNNSPQPLAA